MDIVKVSACITTYNQEDFIRECLDNAINQIVDFEYEIVIGEDNSSDNTKQICQEYAAKYPDLIKFFPREKNLGMMGNWIQTIENCQGKYIAFCEGDDYWTDAYKLKKQFDFLEENKEYSYCGHKSLVLEDGIFTPIELNIKEISLPILLNKNMLNTATLVFRKVCIVPIPPFFKNATAGDWLLQITALQKGNGYILDDYMSVYRKHIGGIWSSLLPKEMCESGVTTLKQAKLIFNDKKTKLLIDNAIRGRRQSFNLIKISFIDRIKFRIIKILKK